MPKLFGWLFGCFPFRLLHFRPFGGRGGLSFFGFFYLLVVVAQIAHLPSFVNYNSNFPVFLNKPVEGF